MSLDWSEISPIAQEPNIENADLRKISEEAFNQAMAEAETACAWLENYVLKKDVTNLGKKISNAYRKIYSESYYPDNEARVAINWLWIIQRRWYLTWIGWMEAGHVYDNDYTRKIAQDIIVFHGGDAGMALTISIDFYNTQRKDFGIPPSILYSIALTWFCKADDLFQAGTIIEAIDLIADAYSVLGKAEFMSTHFAHFEDQANVGKKAADARHGQPGGYRDKKNKILSIWASGKYKTRNDCADKEYKKLGLSRKTTRDHLQGTPDPNPWLAKSK